VFERAHPSVQQQRAMTDQAWETFVAFLRDRGDRVTAARKIVFGAAFARHDHFQADDLARQLAHGRSRVSRGTVYRTLALMVRAGLVREIRDRQTHAHYEHIFGHPDHEHMVCTQCGCFLEFRDPELGKRLRAVAFQAGFAHAGHRVIIFGVCSQCRDQAGAPKAEGPPQR
jgi:Fur family ferric uptake transcriptional regulator